MSIFIGGSMDGMNVDASKSGDFITKNDTYLLREYWKRDGIGGTVHALKFWVSNRISLNEAVFKIELYLKHNDLVKGAHE